MGHFKQGCFRIVKHYKQYKFGMCIVCGPPFKARPWTNIEHLQLCLAPLLTTCIHVISCVQTIHTHPPYHPHIVPQNRRFSYNSPSSSHTSDPTIPNQPQTPPPSHTTSDRDTSSHLTNGTTASDNDRGSSTSVEEMTHSESLPPNRIPTTNHYQPLKLGNVPEPVPAYMECYTRQGRSSPKNETDEPDSSPPFQRPISAVAKTRGSSEARSSSSSIDANSLGNLALEITSLQMNAKCLEDRTSALEANGEHTGEEISSLREEVSRVVSSVEQLAERQEAMEDDIKRLRKKLDAVSQQGANGAAKSQGQGNIKEKNRQYLSSLSCKQVSIHAHIVCR